MTAHQAGWIIREHGRPWLLSFPGYSATYANENFAYFFMRALSFQFI